MGLKEAMLHVERKQALRGALEALEPKHIGRPKKRQEVDPQELQQLREENAKLREELRKVQVKADYQEALEGLRGREKVAEKKTKARARKR